MRIRGHGSACGRLDDLPGAVYLAQLERPHPRDALRRSAADPAHVRGPALAVGACDCRTDVEVTPPELERLRLESRERSREGARVHGGPDELRRIRVEVLVGSRVPA